MIKQLQTLLVLGAGLGLVACNAGGQSDAQAAEQNEIADNATPLPPSIAASRSFRCADGATVYVDFMSDNATAHLRTKDGDEITQLKTPEAGGPFIAEGYSVSANAAEAEIQLPGAKSQHCKS